MIESLVSIIIPTFNRSHYIKRAINSVLNQTYENIEIIIVDDCSNDDTMSIIKSFRDKKIHYYRNTKNRGASFSRNKALAFSKGKYINFLDDDDVLLPNKIELQIKKFKNSNIQNLGVITCDIEYKRPDMKEIKKNHKNGNIYKDLLKEYCIHGIQTMLIDRDFIHKFDLNLKSNQEYDLAIRLSKRCNFDYVPKRLAITYSSKNQISFDYRKKIKGTKYLYKKYVREFKSFGLKFFIYNWIRFKYLLLRYYLNLFLNNNQTNEILNKIHKLILNLVKML